MLPTPVTGTFSPMGKSHVLFVNFPAYGHVTPLLELAKKVSVSHRITFAVSSYMLPELRRRELLCEHNQVELFGIEDGIDSTIAASIETEEGMKHVMRLLLPAVKELLRSIPTRVAPNPVAVHALTEPVDVVIADIFVGQELLVCAERKIPFYVFNTANAQQTLWFLSLDSDTPTVDDDEADVFDSLPAPGTRIRAPIARSWKEVFVPMPISIPGSNGLIINTCRDLEVPTVNEIENYPDKSNANVYCVGPLFPEATTSQQTVENNVKEWLDRQQTNSIIYVSFGSVASPSNEQLSVLAQALLKLNRPFVWSLQEKYYAALPNDITGKISSNRQTVKQKISNSMLTCLDQFHDPSSKFLILKWAPQKLILGHPAVAAFLSHCGWNSSLESISSGKPIIGWPLFGDQLWNAQWAAQLGCGVLIPGTNLKCTRIVPEEEIRRAIEKVACWCAGTEINYAANAQLWGSKTNSTWTAEGSSYKDFHRLLQRL